jgi:predicted nucleotidyltransferase
MRMALEEAAKCKAEGNLAAGSVARGEAGPDSDVDFLGEREPGSTANPRCFNS